MRWGVADAIVDLVGELSHLCLARHNQAYN